MSAPAPPTELRAAPGASAEGAAAERAARARALTAPFADEYPFEPRFCDVGPGWMHYLDEGPREGETLLCLHGNPTWSFFYRRLARALSGERRVVAPDHLGCGLSDKPQDWSYRLTDHVANLERFVLALDLRRVTLVLHDWGGAIGMGLAARLSDRIARLVILNSAAFVGRVPLRIALCRAPLFGELAIRRGNAFLRAALRMALAHPERLTPAARRGYLAPYPDAASRIAHWRFVRDIPTSPRHLSHATLGAIEAALPRFQKLPTILFWGERDFCFTPAFRRAWQERFSGAEVHAYEDAGHWVLEEAHERILPCLRAFLDASPLR